jgi:catechol 2,3-dioxygenase-like lactoylglutathione lyase family enzyme
VIIDVNRASFFANIPVSDLERAKSFYRDVMGLELAREHPAGAAFRTGQSYIELYPSQAAGLAKHTLDSFEVDDINAAMAALRARGASFEEYDLPTLKTSEGVADMPGGTKVAWLRDPDGNILGIVQPTARTRLVTFPSTGPSPST